MRDWVFRELKEVRRARYLIVGVPDAGLVGLIAATHLIRQVDTELVAYVDSSYLPPVIMYHGGRPYPVMRVHYHSDGGAGYLVLVSEVAMSASGIHSFAQRLVEWGQAKGVERIIMLGGVPSPQRINLEKPGVYAAGVTQADAEFLERAGISIFKEGFVSGPYAAILKECFARSMGGVALLAESFLNYPDPGAAAAVLTALSQVTGLKVDVKPLMEQEEEIRARLRETMRRTMEAMREAGKAYEYAVPAMYV